MNQLYLNKLEYNKILEKLSSYCHTCVGKDFASKLLPSNDKQEVELTLSETNEAVSLIERNGTPPISEIDNIGIYLKLLDNLHHHTLLLLYLHQYLLHMLYQLNLKHQQIPKQIP